MVRFDLKYPFKNEDGVEVDCLELRRPTVGDWTLLEDEEGTFLRSKKLVQLVSGLTPKDIDRMDMADWERVNDEVSGFFRSDSEPSDSKQSEN